MDADYGCYHSFFYETQKKRKFHVGVEVLMCSEGYKYRAKDTAGQTESEIVPLRDCPMKRNCSGELKPVVSKIETEIKKVLEGFPSRDELMTHGW